MLTLSEAKSLARGEILYSNQQSYSNSDRPCRVRVNGAVKTWKTRPDQVKVPMKYGLRDCFYLTEKELGKFALSEEEAKNHTQLKFVAEDLMTTCFVTFTWSLINTDSEKFPANTLQIRIQAKAQDPVEILNFSAPYNVLYDPKPKEMGIVISGLRKWLEIHVRPEVNPVGWNYEAMAKRIVLAITATIHAELRVSNHYENH